MSMALGNGGAVGLMASRVNHHDVCSWRWGGTGRSMALRVNHPNVSSWRPSMVVCRSRETETDTELERALLSAEERLKRGQQIIIRARKVSEERLRKASEGSSLEDIAEMVLKHLTPAPGAYESSTVNEKIRAEIMKLQEEQTKSEHVHKVSEHVGKVLDVLVAPVRIFQSMFFYFTGMRN